MKVIRGRDRLSRAGQPPLRAPAVAIGNFDGVHRGHQALVAEAGRAAAALGGEPGVLTFDPHPARFFAPALAPPMIVSLDRRLELLGEAGAAFALVEPFDAALAAMDPDRFVEEVLVRALGARHVVVGWDFSFGKGRAGNGARLQALGAQHGFGVTIVPAVTVDGLVCSSTKVREFLLEGRIDGANLLLGRRFDLTGPVVTGAGRGRGIGVPTANLHNEGELAPKTGVYAALASRADRPTEVWKAAVNVGTNPTFVQQGGVTIEAHLLDFDGDLYGARLRLEFVARLRDERRFPSVEALIAQIRDDVVRAREILGQNPS
jgi:riboflavin kinase/FMN adenylyltransferase